ncbi:MAG: SsrA-binding protein SmpB [candidate division Zixibacteria bacterium]|jgi:SsrA-binding protein|nr:SsrA-binding protein SmpB [candidate division Zixibacteria bacterium]
MEKKDKNSEAHKADTSSKGRKEEIRIIATNRKARHEYNIIETYEAGIMLRGTEVKALREGKANLKDSYARIDKEEVVLLNMHISPYEKGNRYNQDPTRQRKLLLHRNQIRKLVGRVVGKGLTLIPLKLYFKGSYAKVELALAVGKKLYDRRKAIAEREANRALRRALKERNK